MLINMENNHHTQKMQGYMEALEEEKRKIQVFQRELPLCLELVNQAIEACRQQLSGTTTEYMHGGQSECSEQTSTDEGPVLEEFIPIKRSSANSDEDEDEGGEQRSHKKPKSNDNNSNSNKDKAGDKRKSDWLRSAQLWNQAPDPPPKQDAPPKRVSVVEVKRNGGAFQPFHRDNNGVSHAVKTDNNSNDHTANVIQSLDTNKVHSPAPAAATSSTAGTTTGRGGSSGKKDEKADNDGQTTQRKQRRCWSPELHRRFLQALQQLGGSHAATPKQIRELMKVDGLTNDEVKSHLQKYRLHTRRPGPTTIHPNANSQAPQFLLVGGIWVPPEYAAVAAPAGSGEAAKAAAASGIYAPVSIPPHQASPDHRAQPKQRKDRSASPSEGRGSHSTSGGAQSNDSPSTSSSTHTTTTSPVY